MSSSSSPVRVSVVIPARNAAASLPACLAALRGQDYPVAACEVIVVDDGSEDGTAEAATRAGADQVLTVPHGGPAAARNAGIEASHGDIILFTDADCEAQPGWIAEMVRPFDDPLVVAVKGAYRTRQRPVVARLAQCEFEERYERLSAQPYIDFVDTYAAAFRATVLREAGGFNPALTMNEDVDLAYRLAGRGYRMVFNPHAVVYHRHRASWRGYARLKFWRGYWRTIVYRDHPGKAVHDSYTPHLLKLQVLLAGGSAACGLLALFWRRAAWGSAAGLAALLASALPFTRLVARLDRGAAPWAPLFILVRAAAFAAGVAAGAGHVLLGATRRHRARS